jgi:hypothetical protein
MITVFIRYPIEALLILHGSRCIVRNVTQIV